MTIISKRLKANKDGDHQQNAARDFNGVRHAATTAQLGGAVPGSSLVSTVHKAPPRPPTPPPGQKNKTTAFNSREEGGKHSANTAML